MKSLSRVRLLVTPWTAAYQAPPSMGFSRQEYWSGVPLPSPWITKLVPLIDFEIFFVLLYNIWGKLWQMGIADMNCTYMPTVSLNIPEQIIGWFLV